MSKRCEGCKERCVNSIKTIDTKCYHMSRVPKQGQQGFLATYSKIKALTTKLDNLIDNSHSNRKEV